MGGLVGYAGSIQRQNAMERPKYRAKMYIYIKNGPLYV